MNLLLLAIWGLLPLLSALGDRKRALHYRDHFYVGQQYKVLNGSTLAHGQIYVEHLTPPKVTQPFPVLIIPGRGMTGTNFLNTPDGRSGWADLLLSLGYELYIIDQPARARSPWIQGVDGPLSWLSVERVEQRFTASELYGLWEGANSHTQWPGNGTRGDPIFDRFYASTVPSLTSELEVSEDIAVVGPQLLDTIGKPVILLTHSQAGQLGWIIADSRPSLVQGIIAIEPIGPSFTNAVFSTEPARPFGITEIPLAFSPPIESAADLQPIESSGDSSANFTCFQLPDNRRRQLVNLKDIPVLVVTGDSSYHRVYDACTAEFLERASVPVEHIQLGKAGIFGNGHMLFLELNADKILERVLLPFIKKVSL